MKPEVLMILKRGVRKDPLSYSERQEPFAVIRCPGCRGAGTVDADQWEGEVSIECGNPACDYHETHDLRSQGPAVI